MSSPSTRDTSSVDSIIRALYESVSFLPDSQPDFNRLRSLFHSGGRLIPPKDKDAEQAVVLDVEEFIRNSREFIITTGLESKGFCEQEIRRVEESFGNFVHVFSAYESKNTAGDRDPLQRGINSIQLLYDRDRWWVLTILWDTERPDNPLPSKFR